MLLSLLSLLLLLSLLFLLLLLFLPLVLGAVWRAAAKPPAPHKTLICVACTHLLLLVLARRR